MSQIKGRKLYLPEFVHDWASRYFVRATSYWIDKKTGKVIHEGATPQQAEIFIKKVFDSLIYDPFRNEYYAKN